MLAGQRRALAKLISHVEDETPEAGDIVKAIYPHTGNAYVIGITGAPGTGKSCLVSALAKYIRTQNKTVGIIAVDPTSPFSGGAVLGDRFRMRELAGDAGIFIRSMATRGYLGGLARTTYDVMRIMDAAGFDYILIETVGAGQSEVDIIKTANTTVVVEAPGLGDDIQAIKAGILEIADVLVVNKADNPAVKNTVRALQAMLDLGHRQRVVAHHGQIMVQHDGGEPQYDFWQTPIVETIAIKPEGVDSLFNAIQSHRAYLLESGMHADREKLRIHTEMVERLKEALLKQLFQRLGPQEMETMVEGIANRTLDPTSAVRSLLEKSS